MRVPDGYPTTAPGWLVEMVTEARAVTLIGHTGLVSHALAIPRHGDRDPEWTIDRPTLVPLADLDVEQAVERAAFAECEEEAKRYGDRPATLADWRNRYLCRERHLRDVRPIVLAALDVTDLYPDHPGETPADDGEFL